MIRVDIKSLFNKSRFPNDPVSLFWIIVYWPFGVLLVFLRFHIVLCIYMLTNLLPNTQTLKQVCCRGICGALGILIREHEKYKRDKALKLLITNHVSSWDSFAMHLATGSSSPCKWDFPEILLSSMGLQDYTAFGSINQCTKHLLKRVPAPEIVQRNSTLESTGVVALTPEGVPTNGKALLKFAEWPFELGECVQPATIVITRPGICNLQNSVIGSSRNWDTFWMMFSPYTIYHITYLNPIRIPTDAECSTTSSTDLNTIRTTKFCDNVSTAIAKALGIPKTEFTSADAAEYERRRLMESNVQRSWQQQTHITPDIQRMANQVREVMSTVPMNVIIKDLVVTRSVDLTLRNILEGHVRYTPEPSPTTSGAQSRSQASSKPAQSHKSAMSFGSNDRLSFQQRKQQMISEARDRYIKKHGLCC
ncbi:ancient ubiquitous protein 1-like [Ctenocephalides felis]|uniref:ancient ubiquitous protein 1-like n=1 Tax=Ctenocephalides felis TaxID=7515 RepID=UPI000E6E2F1D|nr:ancient ubiquitous protein 1-like [Ctenocephalides felis]